MDTIFMFILFYILIGGALCLILLHYPYIKTPNKNQSIMLAILFGPVFWLIELYKYLGKN